MNDMDDLSQQYLRLRQKRELLKERFLAEDGAYEKEMAEIEERLLDTLNQANSNSMSTNGVVAFSSSGTNVVRVPLMNPASDVFLRRLPP